MNFADLCYLNSPQIETHVQIFNNVGKVTLPSVIGILVPQFQPIRGRIAVDIGRCKCHPAAEEVLKCGLNTFLMTVAWVEMKQVKLVKLVFKPECPGALRKVLCEMYPTEVEVK